MSLTHFRRRIKAMFPDEYSYYPQTWVLPADRAELLAYWATRGSRRPARVASSGKVCAPVCSCLLAVVCVRVCVGMCV